MGFCVADDGAGQRVLAVGLDPCGDGEQPVGVGIREPFVAQPRSMADARQNMRVEFLLMRVDAEVSSSSDFDY